MGRKVMLRVSYTNDAQYLLRLIGAVEKDGRVPPEWRGRIIAHLRSVATSFIEIDSSIAKGRTG